MKIGWWVGSDIDWAFLHYAKSIQTHFPEADHVENEHGDINVVASLSFLPHVGADNSCICRISGRRVFEGRGVTFDFDEPVPATKKRIGWFIGKTAWAFRNLARHIQKVLTDFTHKDNIRQDINVVLAPDLLIQSGGDPSTVYHLDGNRIFENNGVYFDFEQKQKPAVAKDKIIHLIWAKGIWSWGVVYNAIQKQLSDQFEFEAVEFTDYRCRSEKPVDCFYFCQNVTQLACIPEAAKKNAITRLGGNMNFKGLDL